MSEKKLRIYPDPVLREANEEISLFDEAFRSFVEEMKALMYAYDETITVEALDEKGDRQVIEAKGLLARAFAHEIDHLNGVLLIDHLSPLRRTFAKKKFRRLHEA